MHKLFIFLIFCSKLQPYKCTKKTPKDHSSEVFCFYGCFRFLSARVSYFFAAMAAWAALRRAIGTRKGEQET